MWWEVSVLVGVAACGRLGFDAGRLGDGGALDDSGDAGMSVRRNRAFVTSATHPVPFGGVAAADTACQAAAESANLGGTFIALLGSETARPLPRLSAARGWVDLAGAQLVDQPTDWFDGSMRRPLHRDESGALLPYGTIWIGASAGATCSDWTTTSDNGSIAYTTNYFDEFNVTSCAAPGRFACVETMFTAPLDDPAQLGRVAFVTSTMWLPGGGLADADAFCMATAGAAGLGGSFKALLATTTATAVSRFTLTGPTWVNRTGQPLFATASDLASGVYLTAFLRTELATPASGSPAFWAWTGDAIDNCNDYTSVNAGQSAMTGDASSADRGQLFVRQIYPCNIARPLICLQE